MATTLSITDPAAIANYSSVAILLKVLEILESRAATAAAIRGAIKAHPIVITT